jgi:LysR family hydrogen peroxide-inducible transcriptional activator
METQHVCYFLAICDELSFTHAAQKCGTKQPSLSETIERMEQAIGGDLFVRSSPVRLTALGASYVPIREQLEKACAMSSFDDVGHFPDQRQRGAIPTVV